MIRTALHRSSAVASRVAARSKSSKSALDGDSGGFATHAHHKMTTALVVASPLVFLMPDSMTDGIVNQVFGGVMAVVVAGHSWIGLNYVATDYVPKINKSLLGPSRVLNAAIGGLTLVGLGAIAFNGKGGIKGTIKGLWNPKKE